MRIYLNISAARDALPMHIARRYMLCCHSHDKSWTEIESCKLFRLLRYWSNISYKQVTIIVCLIARECIETTIVYRDKIFYAIHLFKVRTINKVINKKSYRLFYH